ncbi:uncharacterized protein BJ171DRAFT_599697, partial [Polychytrium aggregatum]|uniref:uncharacterized protein n=1 Tax=Polychytrium aggregatum TaxID=110093 RepID=UPI0022FE4515
MVVQNQPAQLQRMDGFLPFKFHAYVIVTHDPEVESSVLEIQREDYLSVATRSSRSRTRSPSRSRSRSRSVHRPSSSYGISPFHASRSRFDTPQSDRHQGASDEDSDSPSQAPASLSPSPFLDGTTAKPFLVICPPLSLIEELEKNTLKMWDAVRKQLGQDPYEISPESRCFLQNSRGTFVAKELPVSYGLVDDEVIYLVIVVPKDATPPTPSPRPPSPVAVANDVPVKPKTAAPPVPSTEASEPTPQSSESAAVVKPKPTTPPVSTIAASKTTPQPNQPTAAAKPTPQSSQPGAVAKSAPQSSQPAAAGKSKPAAPSASTIAAVKSAPPQSQPRTAANPISQPIRFTAPSQIAAAPPPI